MDKNVNIDKIHQRWILDSRGLPTIEAVVFLSDGSWGRAAVPSGASTGRYEALEMRDGGKAFSGKGVDKALDIIEDVIAPKLIGMGANDQRAIDTTLIDLDGTSNKKHLGANAILAVSLAVSRATAVNLGLPYYQYIAQLSGMEPGLPLPMANFINGGAHAGFATDVQEYMVIPKGGHDLRTRLRMLSELYQTLKAIFEENSWPLGVGDEGGFIMPRGRDNEAALDILSKAVEASGYRLGEDFTFALDVAASELFGDGGYRIGRKSLNTGEMIDWLEGLTKKYPIESIEDGLSQDDWVGWQSLTKRLGERCLIVGDDLFTTNTQRIRRGIEKDCANTVLIKPNQIGTLTETIDAVRETRQAEWAAIISHRSGETEDTTIAHIAVGTGVGWIKTGATVRGERTAKYNELLRIADDFLT